MPDTNQKLFTRVTLRNLGAFAEAFERRGYAHFGGANLIISPDIEVARHEFVAALTDLPLDPHCKAKNRYRRYMRYILHPWTGELNAIPPAWSNELKAMVTEYSQAANLNADHPGETRRFHSLTERQASNAFLRELIYFNYNLMAWHMQWQWPVLVGVHAIRHVAVVGSPAASSPDHLHRDGEWWTSVVLISRTNVDGGVSIISTPDQAGRHPNDVPSASLLFEHTLTQELDTIIVKDDAVAHYVSPVTVRPGHETGERTVILIDCVPLDPALLT